MRQMDITNVTQFKYFSRLIDDIHSTKSTVVVPDYCWLKTT